MQSKPQKLAPQLKAPVLPKKFGGRDIPQGQLYAHEQYTQLMLTHAQFSGQVAARVTCEQMLLKQVSLHATELAQIRLSDSRLVECDLANASWFQTDFLRVEMLNCRLTGFHAIEARLQDVLFKDCHASLAQFRFANFKSVRFENCDLSDADFQGADLSGVIFVNCDLQRAEMSGAKLVGSDLRGCAIDGLHAGLQELRGATIDPTQALALLKAFGIGVEWPS